MGLSKSTPRCGKRPIGSLRSRIEVNEVTGKKGLRGIWRPGLWPLGCLLTGASKESESRLGGCDHGEKTTCLSQDQNRPAALHFRQVFWESKDSRVLCRCSGVFSKSTPTYAHDPEREQKEPQQITARHASGRRHIPSFYGLASHSNFTPSDGKSAIVRWDAFDSPRGCGRGLKNDGRGDPRPRPRESQKKGPLSNTIPCYSLSHNCVRTTPT
jgi:hypothetical protein